MATRPKSSSAILGDLRPSQIVTSFGPGAVIDQPTASLILAGTNYWTVSDDQRIDEPRLKALLRVRSLYRPRIRSDSGMRGIPAFVFPRFLVCPRCQRLAAFEHFQFDGRFFRCRNRSGHREQELGARLLPRAFPARFVVACPGGHLDDFPWAYYVHRGKDTQCDPLELTFFESNESGAISDLFVRCRACSSTRSMEAAFDDSAEKALGSCGGGRPWLADREDSCVELPRTVLRGASNLYFPIIQSALSIPQWDDPIHMGLAHHDEDLEKVDSLDRLKQAIEWGLLSRLQDFPADEVWSALQSRRRVEAEPPTPRDLRYEEFMALGQQTDPALAAERQFQTMFAETPKAFSRFLDRLVIVRRLREVRALDAFTRIDAPPDLLLEDDEALQKVRRQVLGHVGNDWRPAVELLGEGVFLALREDTVRSWESEPDVEERRAALEAAYRRWRKSRDLPDAAFPGARFVLLHSLAHMLITGLALDCGYSSTSIRERIYSSADPDRPMAGILLYTATPDSDGSLGGLAEQGQTDRFEHLLRLSLRRAGYCSSDPLCGHTAPGEMGDTNGAACHACLLVSETSCERSNHFLDRAHVVSTVTQLDIEYFKGDLTTGSFHALVASLVARESSDTLDRFEAALDDGRIGPSPTIATVQDELGIDSSRAQGFREVLLSSAGRSGDDVLELLRFGRQCTVRARADAPTVEVAWTHPGPVLPAFRTSGSVAREVIDGAERSLLVVGYSVTVDADLAGLAAQTITAMGRAASRGIVVTSILHRNPKNREALLRGWPPGREPPGYSPGPSERRMRRHRSMRRCLWPMHETRWSPPRT